MAQYGVPTGDQTKGWEGLLDPGEEILWQGRPDGAVVFRPRNLMTFFFGLFFAGFALFWMIMASQAGGFFWMFGLIHFAVGAGISLGGIFGPAYKRRRTWYTLSSKRAFIATDLPLLGKKLKSYPITRDTVLEFSDEALASVHFAQKRKRTKNGSYLVPIGFDRISDGREVYRMMRDIQRNDRLSDGA